MTHMQILKTLVIMAITISIAFSAGTAAVAQEGDSAERIRIVVYLIEASDGVPSVDPQIRDIVKQLHSTLRYSTYKLHSKIPKTLSVGEEEKISLPGSREMRLYARGQEDGLMKFKVKISSKEDGGRSRDVLNTEFRLGKSGTIVIGGYDYNDSKLIVAISPEK